MSVVKVKRLCAASLGNLRAFSITALMTVLVSLPRITEEIQNAFDAMDRDNGVLVGTPELLQGILTPMDFLRYLYRIASPFVMISEIELTLRALIMNAVTPTELAECATRVLAQHYGADKAPLRSRKAAKGILVGAFTVKCGVSGRIRSEARQCRVRHLRLKVASRCLMQAMARNSQRRALPLRVNVAARDVRSWQAADSLAGGLLTARKAFVIAVAIFDGSNATTAPFRRMIRLSPIEREMFIGSIIAVPR